ncbi:MAG: hypothetical protein SFW35_13995 [Chitinophagales bacterium]|nr:hypothetical protein [Chitinophagales bacterium]
MKDFRDPRVRQKFLQESVNRNLLIQKLKRIQMETSANRLVSDANLIGNLIDFFENNEEAEYQRLMKQFKLRRLNII